MPGNWSLEITYYFCVLGIYSNSHMLNLCERLNNVHAHHSCIDGLMQVLQRWSWPSSVSISPENMLEMHIPRPCFTIWKLLGPSNLWF